MTGASDIVQNCWIVPDLDAAVRHWLDEGFGPFLTLEARLDDARHFGQPAPITVRTAFTQAGSVQIELVQQITDGPSAYRDMFGPDEGGFHHICRIVDDYDAEVADLKRRGIELACDGTFGPIRYCYADTRNTLGCMLELVSDGEAIRALYDAVRVGCENWDGRNPVRPLIL